MSAVSHLFLVLPACEFQCCAEWTSAMAPPEHTFLLSILTLSVVYSLNGTSSSNCAVHTHSVTLGACSHYSSDHEYESSVDARP